MSLDENIAQLEELIAAIRHASLTDESTKLGSALALRREERQINDGVSKFDVVVFGDINDFKHLNDEHGHEAGNLAITEVGERIQRWIQDLNAKAFRPSGDEFVILVNHDFVENLVAATLPLANILFSHKDKKLRTAISFGYVRSDGKTTFSDLLERAEVACQYAKTHGDGTCIEWSEEIRSNPLVRLSARCQLCGARSVSNVPRENSPELLVCCPCCGKSF